MKKHLTLAMLSSFLMIGVSFADAGPDGSGFGAGFSTSDAQAAFSSGVAPSAQQLSGEWLWVGYADLRSDINQSFYLSNAPDATGAFEFTDNAGFFGKEGVTNLYLAGQYNEQIAVEPGGGPDLEVTLGTTGATFQQNTVQDGTMTVQKSYESIECRLVASNYAQMVCAATLHVDSSEYASTPPGVQALDGKIEGYIGLQQGNLVPGLVPPPPPMPSVNSCPAGTYWYLNACRRLPVIRSLP
jgi:hypothetical protein